MYETTTDGEEPSKCGSCERQGPFTLNGEKSEGTDYQILRLEKPAEERQDNTSPHLDVRVEGSLVKYLDEREVNSGSRITVSGVLRIKPESDIEEWYMEARAATVDDDDITGIEPTPDEREQIQELAAGEHGDPYELIAGSIAPSLKGVETVDGVEYLGEEKPKLWWIKLTAGLSGLYQGWRRSNGDGTFQRGTSHMLLIGDPSTGKSTILESIKNISPRSASTSGKDATAAGLTAAAVNKNDFGGNSWTLEAGVLVKGHRGVATVDELDKMREDAVSSMHSALEQQRLEVSKAGISATLPCETALLAAANPVDSRFNRYDDDHEQINLVDSLLDRFDAVFMLHDRPDEDFDREIAGHVLETRTERGRVARGDKDESESGAQPAVNEDLLRKWVAIAREEYQPVVEDDDVIEALVDFYVDIRSENSTEEGDGPVPATTRNIKGVVRLAEAAARVELSDEITMRHAELAMSIVRASLQDIGYDPETGKLDADYMTGRTSHSQRDRIGRLKGMIKNLEPSQDTAGVEVGEILDVAESAGLDREKAKHDIEKLKQQGEAYEPQTDTIRTT